VRTLAPELALELGQRSEQVDLQAPEAVVVSICWSSARKPTPRVSSSSRASPGA